jgi:hypothetical protein
MAEHTAPARPAGDGEPAVAITDSIEGIVDQVVADGLSLLPADAVSELVRTERLYAARGLPVRYAVATREGRVCGLLPIYPAAPPFAPYADPDALFGPRPGGWMRGSYLGSMGHLPNYAAAAGPHREDVLRRLLTSAVDACTGDGADFACVPLVRDELVEDIRRSLSHDVVANWTTHEAVIDIAFSSFEEYIESLPARGRRYVRRQRRGFAESGLKVIEVPLIDAVRDLAPLIRNVEHKYGNDQSLEVFEIYLVTIALAMGGHATTLVAHDGESPAAFSVIWHHGRDWRMRTWGCDYARTNRTFAYFNVFIYEPVARAAAAGARSLILGTETLQTKLERGARLDRLTTLGLPLRSSTTG